MEFYKILQSIMADKNLKISEVSRLSGLPDSTIRSILSRKNRTVSLKVAFKLSKGLNIPLERLSGETSDTSVKTSKTLSPIHQETLMKIEKMSETRVKAVLAFIDCLDEIDKKFQSLTIPYAAFDGKGVEFIELSEKDAEKAESAFKKLFPEETE